MRLRTRLPLMLLLLLTFAKVLEAQTEMNFARVLSASQRQTTGFAVVNPNSFAAGVRFTLYNSNGSALASQTETIGAGGQLARLASQIFPAATGTGWVQAVSQSSGLQGFWLSGDFATYTDGAVAAQAYIDHLLPVVNDAEINIANSSNGSVAATIYAFDANGNELASIFRPLQPKAFVQQRVSQMFSPLVASQATHIRISCSTPFVTSAVLDNFLVQPGLAVVNGVDAGFFIEELRFPHMVSGKANGAHYTTLVNVTNLSNQSQNVTFTFTPSAGATATASTTIQVAGNGTIRATAAALFGFAADLWMDGWVRVEGESGITGFVAYADLSKSSVAVVPAQTQAQSRLLFAHIADLDPWWTGIALLNDSGATATVEVYAMAQDGSLIGGAGNVPTARFDIPPGQKVARLLSQWIPQTQARASDGGFVFVRTTNGVPLFGTELFFTRDLQVLANVSAGTLADGLNYVPPSP